MTITNDDMVFQHIIDLPHSDCVFCATKQKTTGRTSLFLIFPNKERVYMRNGVNGTWDELKDDEFCKSFRGDFVNVVEERRIPCFSAY